MRPLSQSEAAMNVAAPIIVGVAITALWELLCRAFDVPVFLVPKPSDIGPSEGAL